MTRSYALNKNDAIKAGIRRLREIQDEAGSDINLWSRKTIKLMEDALTENEYEYGDPELNTTEYWSRLSTKEKLEIMTGARNAAERHRKQIETINARLIDALKFSKEIIDDQAIRFHKDCRCQLCEAAPMVINAALGIGEGAK